MVPRIALGSQRARPCIESFGVSGAWASSRARTMATRGPVSTTVRSLTSKAFHLVRVGGEVRRGLGSSTLEAAVQASLTQDIKSRHLALIRPAPWPRRGLPALIDLMIDKGGCLSLNSEQGRHRKWPIRRPRSSSIRGRIRVRSRPAASRSLQGTPGDRPRPGGQNLGYAGVIVGL